VIDRSLDSTSPANHLVKRLRWIILVSLAAFGVLVGRLWQMQVVRGEEYFEAARDNVVAERTVQPIRGEILDRNRQPLAINRPAFSVYATPREMTVERVARLKSILGLSADEHQTLVERLAAAKEAPRTPIPILEGQGRDRAALLLQARMEFPGLRVKDEAVRLYPQGSLAAHLIGYMNQVTAEDLEELSREGYGPNALVGRYGLEKQWESYLRGRRGVDRYVVNARQQRVHSAEAEALIDGPLYQPPVPGHNLILTIDLELQRAIEKALSAHQAGAVAVVEVQTGRVLGLASRPAFDPNVMSGRLTRDREAAMLADPRKPFLDKTLRRHFPPGSTYKFVAAVAGLEDKVIDRYFTEQCPGYYEEGSRRFHCTKIHGWENIVHAIQHSCNVFFWKLAMRIGIDRMAQVAFDFGFGAPTGLGLNGDVAGRIPTRAWYEQRTPYKLGFTLNVAVGQGDVAVTVLQLAMAYAAIANGGKLFAPQVVQRLETPSGEIISNYQPVLRRRVAASDQTLGYLRAGMERAVNELGGTAFEYGKSERATYAGKTGTAQVRNRRISNDETGGSWDPNRDHAWFAGYAPADNPEIAIVVFIEHGGAGGHVAAPIARKVVEAYVALTEPEERL
jgi:penicillin-binding protein 2